MSEGPVINSTPATLELCEVDVSAAIEYWLNQRVLRQPCTVSEVRITGRTQWEPLTFRVHFVEEDPGE